MQFIETKPHPTYYTIWANDHDGGEYHAIAHVKQISDGKWRWEATDYQVLPKNNPTVQSTKSECIADCEKTALMRQMERAIEAQPKRSDDWHSPRREALKDMDRSPLFTLDEIDDWKFKAFTYEE